MAAFLMVRVLCFGNFGFGGLVSALLRFRLISIFHFLFIFKSKS